LREWIRWINSREDGKAPEPDRTNIERLHRDLVEGRNALFVLEPSCGAEMAVLCESVSILTRRS
jgi:hypothetical protein